MQLTNETPDPVAIGYRRRRRWVRLGLALILYFIGIIVYWGLLAEAPHDESNPAEQFKYGSIGSDSDNGLPYWIWRVLPEIFPQHLPDEEAFLALPENERTGFAGYKQFGFVFEADRDRPIGFSKRRDLVERVGLNCAVCHVGTVRYPADEEAPTGYRRTADGQSLIVPGMPAHTVDLQAYFQFLFNCANDARFTSENLLAHIEGRTDLNPYQRTIYKQAVPNVRSILITRSHQLDYFERIPSFGPGRVDTFTPYKTMVFGFAYDGTVGTSDFPSIWNQRPREGMDLHWDGNNKSVFERNISASLGAGATPTSLDMPRMLAVAQWIGSPPVEADRKLTADQMRRLRGQHVPHPDEMPIPKYPFEINSDAAERGRIVYRQHCASCHDWKGEQIGQIVPLDEIGTDPERLNSYTLELAVNQNTLGVGTPWRFANFRKTEGYSNMPLDGVWARAPYLHNGSVPTLRDLLLPVEQRPKKFYRGDDRFDEVNVGFRSEVDETETQNESKQVGRRSQFLFDTEKRGNSNAGHTYGVDLTDDEKDQLLEYLKTL